MHLWQKYHLFLKNRKTNNNRHILISKKKSNFRKTTIFSKSKTTSVYQCVGFLSVYDICFHFCYTWPCSIHCSSVICWLLTLFNPFVLNAPFLYPLKASEKRKVFWCFQGVEKRCIGNEWVKGRVPPNFNSF